MESNLNFWTFLIFWFLFNFVENSMQLLTSRCRMIILPFHLSTEQPYNRVQAGVQLHEGQEVRGRHWRLSRYPGQASKLSKNQERNSRKIQGQLETLNLNSTDSTILELKENPTSFLKGQTKNNFRPKNKGSMKSAFTTFLKLRFELR